MRPQSATKETSWEQPLTAAPSKEVAEEDVKTLAKAKAEKEATASRAQTAAEDANNKYQAAVNEEQRLAQAAQAAQGAGQAADAKAAQAAQQAQQARLVAEQATAAEDAATKAAAAIAEAPLEIVADGWQAVSGPQGVYYYNDSTKETAWEPKKMLAPAKEDCEAKLKAAQKAQAEAEKEANDAAGGANKAGVAAQEGQADEQKQMQLAQQAADGP